MARVTLRDEIESRLKAAILSGEIRTDDRLVESRIAQDLGVSRAPVREALRQLEKDGLIVSRTHRGYFVRTLDLDDLRELFQLRLALERLAISLAIERAEAADLDRLQEVVERMDALDDSEEHLKEAAELDTTFHEQICRLARHKRLLELWVSMRQQISVAILASNLSFPEVSGFADSHRRVLEALQTRDIAAAEAALEHHIELGLRSLLSSAAVAASSTDESSGRTGGVDGKSLL